MKTAELGLTCLEIGWVRSINVSQDSCRQIQQAADQAQISLSVHAPYFINLNAGKEEWPRSQARLMKAARMGFLAGATDIIFHPGSYLGESQHKALAIAIARLTECKDLLDMEGINVTLRPEMMGKQSLIGSFLEVLELSEKIEGVQPCLDAAHLFARTGDGSLNDQRSWEELLEDYKLKLGEKSLQTLHVHISGIQYSSKGEVRHLPIRESDFRFDSLLSALKTYQCSGRILCESPLMEDDAVFLRDTFESL